MRSALRGKRAFTLALALGMAAGCQPQEPAATPPPAVSAVDGEAIIGDGAGRLETVDFDSTIVVVDVLEQRYEGEKQMRKWKTMSNWVPEP